MSHLAQRDREPVLAWIRGEGLSIVEAATVLAWQ
jgi:hypothetical protein